MSAFSFLGERELIDLEERRGGRFVIDSGKETPKSQVGVNPKDMVGATKYPVGLVPPIAIAATSMSMQEGATTYGPYNWRRKSAPVQMMIYLEAAMGHIQSLIDGEDFDPKSGLHHAGKGIACLAIIIDALACGNMIDNRPTKWPNRRPGNFTREVTAEGNVIGIPDKIRELLKKPWATYPDEGEPDLGNAKNDDLR